MKKLFLTLLLGLFLINCTSAITWNEVLYYTFDDNAASTNVISLTGSANGTLVGGDNTEDISVAGKISTAFDFDGSADYVNSNGQDLNLTGNLSFNMWIYPHSVDSQENFFDFTDGEDVQLILSDGSDMKIRALMAGGADFRSDITLENNTWYMITYVYAEGVSTTLYINAQENGTQASTTGSGGDTNVIWIGNYDGNKYFDGLIDEVSTWGRALTQSDIDDLYNSGNGRNPNTEGCLLEYNGTNTSTTCTAAPTINLPTNIVDYGRQGANLTVNYTSDGTVYLQNITLQDGENQLRLYYINGSGVLQNVTNVSWTYKIFEDSRTFNVSTYETAKEGYVLGITANSSLTAVSLIYNGTSYAMTQSGTNWSYSRDLPSAIVGTQTFNFRFTYGGDTINSDSSTQSVNSIFFTLCNSSYTDSFLNISFRDEGNSSIINASIPASTFNYYLGDGTVTKEYTFSDTTALSNFTFCASPTNKTFNVVPNVQYKYDSDYPQRIWNPTAQSYTNDSTNQILYLLSSADGIYVTFQVINTADQLLSGVDITAERTFSGVSTVVASGTTSAAGSVTFWLNPDFTHTFNFSRAGYDNYSYSDAPTQTSYTITLGSDTQAQNSTVRGIDYSITPTNSFLENNTVYAFSFYLSSSFWDVSDYGFNLRLANGTIIDGGNTGTEETNLSVNYNTTNQTIVYMDYYWVINGNYTNATRYWVVQNTNYKGYSIKTFFTDFNSYLDSGMFGLDNFGMMLIVFFVIFISSGVLSYKYGITNPMAVSSLVFAIVFFFDVTVSLIPDIRGISNLPTFIVGTIFVLTIINEVKNR